MVVIKLGLEYDSSFDVKLIFTASHKANWPRFSAKAKYQLNLC